MTDRTGGPSSPSYAHRESPENYEEEDEAYSDGEDINTLVLRSFVENALSSDNSYVLELAAAFAYTDFGV